MIYLELFVGFLKVGLFSFGGGYASIPLIRDVVMSYGWLSEDMLTYMIAVSESTPGPIMVNLATYVGITQGGMLGAFVATFAVVLPAFFIIIAIVAFLSRVIENPYVAAVMQGLKSCVTGIILATGVHMVIRNCMISEAMAENSFGRNLLRQQKTKACSRKKKRPDAYTADRNLGCAGDDRVQIAEEIITAVLVGGEYNG